MGPGINVPLSDGELVLGTWQQIIVIVDFFASDKLSI
jgi:thiamine phosphate synthase YjbQ (UPF0047 family)